MLVAKKTKKMKKPTQGQFLGLWTTAIEMDLNRSTTEDLIKSFTKQMKERRDKILADRDNILTFELKATVRQDRPYIEALEAGGPDTPSGCNSRKVGDLYTPVSDQEKEVEFVLLNFPKGNGSWDKALAWAKSNGYKITNPREAFAVAEQHNLRKLLDRNWLYLVATTQCSFEGYRQAVCVGVVVSRRGAGLDRLGDFGYDRHWFLFRK